MIRRLLISALLLLLGATAHAAKCFPRHGHCVVVEINGQQSVKLTKKTKKMLEPLESVSYRVDDTRYELAEPIGSDFEIQADGAPGSADWFGELRSVDASVIPLQQVDLDTRRERRVEESVRIGGAAAAGEAEVLDENRLPPGRYLLVVTLRGSANWDRQVLYFEVRAN